MKITIDRLKEIILEEIEISEGVEEVLVPKGTKRMSMMSPVDMKKGAPEPDEASFSNFAELFSKIMDAPGGKLSLSKADTKALASMIAQRNLKEQ
tara:strand:+ start:597 stop:881 length:285 start_codon:yes stop_codon:yes gene_type:complete